MRTLVYCAVVIFCITLFTPPIQADGESGDLLLEQWYTDIINGKKVGYYHERYTRRLRDGEAVIVSETDGEIWIKRGESSIRVTFGETTVETEDGVLLSSEARSEQTGVKTKIVSLVRSDAAETTIDAMGTSRTLSIPRPEGIRPLGMYAQRTFMVAAAAAAAAAKRPGEPGKDFTYATFSASLQRFITYKGRVEPAEPVDVFGQSMELTKLVKTDTATGNIEEYLFNSDGDVIIIKTGATGDFYRCSREEALSTIDEDELPDMLSDVTTIPMDFVFLRPWSITEATFRFYGDPEIIERLEFPEDSGIEHERGKDYVIMTIKPPFNEAVREVSLPIPSEPFLEEYLKADAFVTSANPDIAKKAREVTGGERNAYRAAKKLEQFVYGYVEDHFGVGIVPGTHVFEDPKGDCSEHSVLFASLARSLGIPTRLSVGFAGLSLSRGFEFHMWCECYLGGQWLQFDATGFTGDVPNALHIKLIDVSTREQTLEASVQKIHSLLSKLKLETVDYVLDGIKYRPDHEHYYGTIEQKWYRNKVLNLEIELPENSEASLNENPQEIVTIEFPDQNVDVVISAMFMPVYFDMDELQGVLEKLGDKEDLVRLTVAGYEIIQWTTESGMRRLMLFHGDTCLICEAHALEGARALGDKEIPGEKLDGFLESVLERLRFH